MTVNEARSLVKGDPKRWRAAFVEAPGTPLLDHPEASVVLHEKVGAAYDQLRSRKDSLVKQGYAVKFGSLGKCILVLAKDGETRAIGLDKPSLARG